MTTQVQGSHVPEWTWGDRLRKVRRESGLTQAEFAVAIGAKEKAYSAWESDANTPRFDTMRDVAARIQLRFGVPRAWMLGIYEPPATGPDGPNGGASDGGVTVTEPTLLRPRGLHPARLAA